MDSKIKVGENTYKRSFLLNRDSAEGQLILSSARILKTPVFCLCTNNPLRMFVRKDSHGYTLFKQKGTGPEHHADCPSGKESDFITPYGGTTVPRTFDGVVERLNNDQNDNEDLQYLLHQLWINAGFGAWDHYYLPYYYLRKLKLFLTLAAAKIRIDDYTLADLVIIPDLNASQRSRTTSDGELIAEIKSKIDQYQRNPLLLVRLSSIKQSKYSHMVSLKDCTHPIWMKENYHDALAEVSDFQLAELQLDGSNVFGLFEVWLSDKDNINGSLAGLMACNGNGIPYGSHAINKVMTRLMLERKAFFVQMKGFNSMEVDTIR